MQKQAGGVSRDMHIACFGLCRQLPPQQFYHKLSWRLSGRAESTYEQQLSLQSFSYATPSVQGQAREGNRPSATAYLLRQ